jgi:glycosyltransferase involved in cell wall biosynthesis
LLTESTPQAMARAAIRVAKDDGLCNRLSCNALEWSGQFSWDKTASEFIDIIDRHCSSETHKGLQKDYYPMPSGGR